jgi:hypothetical protein
MVVTGGAEDGTPNRQVLWDVPESTLIMIILAKGRNPSAPKKLTSVTPYVWNSTVLLGLRSKLWGLLDALFPAIAGGLC